MAAVNIATKSCRYKARATHTSTEKPLSRDGNGYVTTPVPFITITTKTTITYKHNTKSILTYYDSTTFLQVETGGMVGEESDQCVWRVVLKTATKP